MFDSKLLKLYRTDGAVQSYLYGAAIISTAQDDERIYVSVDRPLPRGITDGILAWFGMDMSRNVARYRCDDNSRYFVQAAA
jgi:hypothetical protein